MSASNVLARLTVAPALLLVAWLVAALPLLLTGTFTIGPALLLFVLAAAVLLTLGFRGVRARAEVARPEASWWAVAGVVAVTLAFLVLQLAMCSEQIIVRRDPASYVQFAAWLTDHGSLPVRQWRWAFGGGDPSLTYQSPAFYQRGDAIIPQFMAGLPLILALGGWIGGMYAMVAMAPVLGACAVLSFAGLVARLVGARWAPLGALALALTLPMQWVSRSTYSELPALVLLLGGLALLHDVREVRSGAARIGALLAGLALGLTVLVRIDGLRDVLPVVVFAGLLTARRRPTGLWLFAGLALGVGAGLLEGFVLSGPYLKYLHASLNPLLLLSGAVVLGTVVMVGLLRAPFSAVRLRRVGVRLSSGRLPDVAAVLTVLVMIGFAVRPYLQTVVRVPANADDRMNASFILLAQRANGLPAEMGRVYYENSLYWVAWYIGVPALLLATAGAALLTRRMARRRSAEWLLPYAVIAWTTVTTLWRPGITPDHPWASRRLISIVIPGLLLLALWALAWAVRRIPRLGYGRGVTGAVALAGVPFLLVPIGVTSAGLLFTRTEQGEVAAVRSLCARLGRDASVVLVERVTADRFTQVIRGMCGVPTARTRPGTSEQDVRRVIGRIYAAGRRPLVLGAAPSNVAPYGEARQVLHIKTRQDEHSLVTPPDGTWGLTIDVWMSEPLRP
ncbi:hypothetical protein [Actinomadura alba]|uniref:Glycosyltransferase RgtA/B/C/D-like domain-containing protein n=1 Tax=Actinomadura alba TaxID=406431 RepID=A0ABR7LIX4_9ACTN|nr:hypothetical protein [Actinomadura alba]MBC6464797.1 hypothetical protein [Actinomadura alba]